MGTITVRAYLNTTESPDGIPVGMLYGYESGHDLTLAYNTTIMATMPDDAICEQVFRLLNVGDDPEFNAVIDPRATTYRAQGHRSLSVGDVVAINHRWYSVDRVGFSAIDAPAAARLHATTTHA